MTPNIHPYRGYWGSYDVGLPYYQAFCNYGNNQDTGDKGCRAGIRAAIYSTATISPKSWQDKVEDFMCPRMADPEILHLSSKMRDYEEASPNLLGVSAVISRPRALTVGFTNENGERIEQDFVDLWATSVQHQIDHFRCRGLRHHKKNQVHRVDNLELILQYNYNRHQIDHWLYKQNHHRRVHFLHSLHT